MAGSWTENYDVLRNRDASLCMALPICGGVAQDFPGRLENIEDNWKLNTREKVMKQDPAVYVLVTDPRFKLPTVLPDGKYKAKTLKIEPYEG